VAKF
jgi:hypothetical protein